MKKQMMICLYMVVFCNSIYTMVQKPPKKRMFNEMPGILTPHQQDDFDFIQERQQLQSSAGMFRLPGPDERLRVVIPDFQVNNGTDHFGAGQDGHFIIVRAGGDFLFSANRLISGGRS